MSSVVISQPMFFPWVGMFEQVRLADTFVFYDDVAFSKGSFTNRVQIPLWGKEFQWLTLPLQKWTLGTPINALQIRPQPDWRKAHLTFLETHYQHAPYRDEMLQLVSETYQEDSSYAAPLLERGMRLVSAYLGLSTRWLCASELPIRGKSSQRVCDLVQWLGAESYITGWGARHYLDHLLFEQAGITVKYMDYRCQPYPQIHRAPDFDPHVSILDLIANRGPYARESLCSDSIDWKEWLHP